MVVDAVVAAAAVVAVADVVEAERDEIGSGNHARRDQDRSESSKSWAK